MIVWGGVGAALSIGLSWIISPQQRLTRITVEERRLRIALKNEEAEIAEGLALARSLLRLAATRIGLLLPPMLVGALPVVCLMAWLETWYGHDLPPSGQTVAVTVNPDSFHGRWVIGDGAVPRVDVVDEQGAVVQSLPILAPVPNIRKRAWWNALIGNPLRYLPDDSPIERIEIGLSERRFLTVGPDWVRGWKAPFVGALVIGSALLKLLFRIR
jgi:hypothetical protein